ncbi:hypothetical protein BCR36DRAFT_294199 [Piromyces finnis]|uniref:LsmAD domain-containing protein n=1 Tax=Piromyces finnis TaxID=1754191 RepID=A0A1Y1V5X9_9FUNG|nr:hypothetical protein BCR36DRAFT_294199 [Piromyces finnis]|eukprot:ORX48088.1 hypothetical protein BCR36DRAFT_294199 [Piromyces finnis]
MNTRKSNNGNERMQGGRSRGNQRKDHFREGGMNSFHNNNYQRQKMKNSNMMNRNDSFSKSQERYENKDSDFPALGETPDRRMHDRLLFVIMNMVGTKVEVTTKNGTVIEGILHGTNTESELGVCLKMAKNITGENSQNNSYIPNLIIMGKDLAQISVTNLELNKQERMSSRDTFKTDLAISGKTGEIFERQLQKWEPEKDNYDVSLELTDDGNEKWDQFATNEKLFGITTDYDEEIYTTALDRTKADFKKREQEAIKIAAEIEKASTENIHLAEERGQLIDDADIDEEDRYGAVIRKPGKYVPPNLRKQMEANKQSNKQNTFEQKKDKDSKAKTEQKSNDNKNKSTTTTNTSTTTTTTSNNTNNKDTESKTASVNASSNNNTNASAVKGPLAKIEKKTNYNEASNKSGTNQNNIQEELINHFRQFSKKEKEHLQQKKQAIMKKEKEGIFSEFKLFSESFKLPELKDLPSDKDLLDSADKTGKELYKANIEKEKKETSKKDIPKKEPANNKQPNLKKSITIPPNNDDSLNNNVTLSASAASTNTTKQNSSSKSVKTPVSAQASSALGKTDSKNESADQKNKNNNDMTVSASVNSTASTESKSTSFKFNIEAREFKPNPSATEFVPSKNLSQKGSSQSSNEKGNIFNKRNQKGNISIHSIFVKGFLKTNNQNTKNNNANINQGSATWNYGSKPFKSQFSVSYDDAMYQPMDQQFGYYIQPIPYQGHPVIRRPYIPISMQPGYPVNYVPAPAYAAPMTHNRPVYPPNMMGPPMAARIYQGPVIVPTYPTEMIPQFSNTVMIPQQPIVIDPGMIPTAQGMPQVYIADQMMAEVPPEQQQQS